MRILTIVVLALIFLFGVPKSLHSGQLSEEQTKQQQDEIDQAKVIAKAEKLVGTWQGQCVIAVRSFLGIGRDTGIVGWARHTPTNSDTPEVGSVIKLNASKYGHLAVVLKVESDQIYIYESNYDLTERARTTWIEKNNPQIMGYLNIKN